MQSGTRCNYLRVNREKKILIFGHDADPRGNPNKVPAGEATRVGHRRSTTCRTRATRRSSPSFRRRRTARCTASMPTTATSMPARQFSTTSTARACRSSTTAIRQQAKTVGTWHVTGQRKGEQYGPLNRNGPDGKPQIIQCHEIVYLQRPRLCRLARRRHGDPRRQGSHRAEAARDLRLQSAVPWRLSRRRAHLDAGGHEARASIPTSSCTPTRSSTARRASDASSTCPT